MTTGPELTAPAPNQSDWFDANKRDLSARVAVIAARLGRHSAPDSDAEAANRELRAAEARAAETSRALPSPSALDGVAAAFGLSPFERDILVLCAGIELEGGFAATCAQAQGDPRRTYPTFGLALAALADPHWSAIAPGGPLREWRLVEVIGDDGLTSSRIRLDERVLQQLTGIPHLDERLRGIVTPVRQHDELTPSQDELARHVAATWSNGLGQADAAVVQLWGEDRLGATGVAVHASHLLGIGLHRIRAGDIGSVAADREALARLWEREAVLSSSALAIDVEDAEGADSAATVRAATSLIDDVHGMVAVIAREPVRGGERTSVRMRVDRHTVEERRTLWASTLGPAAEALDGRLDAVVSQFDLGTRGIRAAGADALARSAGGESGEASEELADVLWESCRSQARSRLDDLAQRIEPVATWEDLVLPEAQGRVLREVALQVRNRTTVYERWGFAQKSARGLGISALFAGPSGTGKTMAAEVLANELRLDLYRIDLSQVVSKYIGETEKNLRRVFDAAEEGGSILLFDEADALFGKRSEVKDSHDRYANIEVSYLLQRMESYRGLAILTTNMKSAIDGAFLRRIRFVVQFPFPDQAQRTEIWRRIFPAETPLEDVDVTALARLNVAGGNIRNIALNAAFLAADAGLPVGMEALLQAARGEYAKLERPMTDTEVRGWS